MKITLIPPFPAGEGGWGDRGQERKLKAGAAGDKEGTPSCGHLLDRFCKCRKRSNAGDARGEAPCIRKLKISPFPTGEGGRGDRGQKRKLKAGAAGNKEGTPPRRAPQRQG